LEDLAQFAMDFMKGFTVDYAEVRYQADQKETLILKNGVIEGFAVNEERGINVRVIDHGSLGFASTDSLTKQSIKSIVKHALKIAHASSRLLRTGVSVERCMLGQAKVEVKPQIEFGNVGLESRVDLLKNADDRAQEAASKAHVKMPNRMFTFDTWTTAKHIITSDGADIRSVTPRAALFTIMTVFQQQAGTAQRSFNLGGTGGWEVVEGWNLPELFSAEGHALSQIILKAKKTPKGTMDLVLGPEVVGLVSHESSGHPGEADRILGREAAQAGETYLKADSLGLRVGSSHVNVVDDPTVKGSFGYYEYDEEGVQARKRTLIKKGIINEFLQNRETASVFGVSSNAASRAVAYNREPIVRMANTFLEPGDYSEEEIFEGVKNGVYIKNFMEWNIDDRRFNQRYVGLEAYHVENGEPKERVKTPVLEVTTIGLWSAVDAVGKDIEFQAAYCGKGDPMQGIPVWTGGPHVRLRNVKLGGA
jgi:TldD protein